MTLKTLPIHPHPIKGELLSSWMTRLAIQNGFYLHEFYKIVLNFDHPLFVRDVDRLKIPGLTRCLAQKTGLKEETICELSLNFFTGILFESLNSNGYSRWILPQGIYHRTRKLKGTQYCPYCLAEDPVRYFRKAWRLSFVTICTIHNCLLLDVCDNCSSPIDYLRVGIGQRLYETPIRDIGICSFCIKPLWKTTPPKLERDMEPYSYEYNNFIADFSNDKVRIARLNQPLCLSEFNGLWILIGRLSGQKSMAVRRKIKDITGISLRGALSGGFGFDSCSLDERYKILVVTFWILEEWPDRFIFLASGTKLSKSAFSDYLQSTPFWLSKIVHGSLDKSLYVLTDEEIVAAAKYLKITTGHVVKSHLAKILNINMSSCSDRLIKIKFDLFS